MSEYNKLGDLELSLVHNQYVILSDKSNIIKKIFIWKSDFFPQNFITFIQIEKLYLNPKKSKKNFFICLKWEEVKWSRIHRNGERKIQHLRLHNMFNNALRFSRNRGVFWMLWQKTSDHQALLDCRPKDERIIPSFPPI